MQRHEAAILGTRFAYRNVGRNRFEIERCGETRVRVHAASLVLLVATMRTAPGSGGT